MRERKKILFALALAAALSLIAASTASAQVQFFVSVAGARPLRAEGLTEATGVVAFAANSPGDIVPNSTISLDYGTAVEPTSGIVSTTCTGGALSKSVSGSVVTLTIITANLHCDIGAGIFVSGARVNANALGAGAIVNVIPSATVPAAFQTTNPIQLIFFPPLAVAVVQSSPSISVTFPTNVKYEVTERFAQAFLSKSDEKALSDNGFVQDFAIRFSFLGVPIGGVISAVDFTGSDPTLTGLVQRGLPFTSQQGAQDVNVDVIIGGTNISAVEKLVATFTMNVAVSATVSLRGGTVPPEVPRFVSTQFVFTPPVWSNLCSPSAPALLSGSTGAQGVLDPGNLIPPNQTEGGLIWPPAAVLATIFLDTGQVVFTDANNALAGTATLPGVSGFPAFPQGKLNFTKVRLPAGKGVVIAAIATPGAAFTSALGVAPPALVLSCQDVVLEAGSSLSVGTAVNGAPILAATATPEVFAKAFPGGGAATSLPAAGFGPRSGPSPAAGSLFPAGGGAGGGSTSSPVLCGFGDVACPSGGFGGGALVVAATQKITVNGTIQAVGTSAPPNSAGPQGGGGGSVRLVAVLVDGIGTINAAGGSGSPAGPIEIEGFVQNLFTGTLTGSATSCTTNKNCAVIAPLPLNLPEIKIVGVAVGTSGDVCQSKCSNTGSLMTPDVTLSPATAQSVTVTARLDLQKCVETALVPALALAFRAVGTDGSAQDKSANTVLGSSCTTATQTQGVLDVTASAVLNLAPAVTYQVVVTTSAAFPLPLSAGRALALQAATGQKPEDRTQESEASRTSFRAASVSERGIGAPTHSASSLRPAVAGSGQAEQAATEPADSEQLLERWSRLFGVESPAGKRLARLSVAVGSEKQ